MELQTKRLILRPWQETDAEALYNIASNPEVGLNAGWEPHTSVEYSREIIRDVFSSQKEFYAVVLKETNELVGSAGFLLGEAKHSKKMGHNDGETGYWIGVPHWGQGLIPEAMRELIRYGFEDLELDAIWAGHYDNNNRSKRVADKLGFTYQHTEEENEKDNPLHLTQDIHFYRITKEKYLQKEDEKTNQTNIKEMNFDQLFTQISPEEMCDNFNVFTLVGKDFFAITAGKQDHYNSMIGSGGGFGLLFRKPATWCVVRADRYTLELMEKEQTYTLSYFPNEYKEQMLFLGSKSGRDSEKMKETPLTSIQTPSGDMAFKEARLIIECKLTQATTITPDDFYTQEAKDYLNDAFKDANVHRKYVFGEITQVWVKK